MDLPDFGGPGEPFGERHPFDRRALSRHRRDNRIPLHQVQFPLDPTVHIIVLLFIDSCFIILEGVSLVVDIQTVLLHQGLQQKGKEKFKSLHEFHFSPSCWHQTSPSWKDQAPRCSSGEDLLPSCCHQSLDKEQPPLPLTLLL